MSDFARDWRPSANVQQPRSQGLRTHLLDYGAYAPDEVRASYGYAPLTPQTRDALLDLYAPEQPYVGGTDYFGRGRPTPLPEPEPAPLPPLGRSFLARNDDAMLGRDVADMLGGGGREDPVGSALAAAFRRYGVR